MKTIGFQKYLSVDSYYLSVADAKAIFNFIIGNNVPHSASLSCYPWNLVPVFVGALLQNHFLGFPFGGCEDGVGMNSYEYAIGGYGWMWCVEKVE